MFHTCQHMKMANIAFLHLDATSRKINYNLRLGGYESIQIEIPIPVTYSFLYVRKTRRSNC